MRSDPALIGAFRKQTAVVLASGDAEAFLGLWAAWKDQAGTCRDDLVDVLKELGQDPPDGPQVPAGGMSFAVIRDGRGLPSGLVELEPSASRPGTVAVPRRSRGRLGG